jgi:tetratricopeptide (TPR) repeat protein
MLPPMPGADQHQLPGSRPVALTSVIGAHLEKVLCSSVFRAADNLRELLRFTVNETMAGRGGELKEYLLAVTVLGKEESFDPKADSIVRAQMRRLREHLRQYYATEGRHDAVVIDIPKGTYMPTFRRTAPDGAVAATTGTEDGLIVGRQKELTDLRSTYESAAAGNGRLVCVSGEPGIGKTTVIESFLRELSMSGVDCYLARGRCSERLAGSEAYLPVLEALETLLRGGDKSLSRLMSVTAPTWYAQIAPLCDSPGGRTSAEDRVPSQERLKREFVAFLDELTSRRPVVLFLDDVHWADASTVDILSYVAARCASHRILIVAAYRSADLLAADHPFLRVKLELTGRGICSEIAMPFLTRGDVDRYLALRFPEHLFPAELSTRIHDRTEGNPLFMADLARFLRDRGVLAERAGRWIMVSQLPEVERELPESVRSMLEKKISQLEDEDRRLLVAASVQGYEFDSAVVSTVLGMDAVEVEERLEALESIHAFVTLVGETEFPDRTFTMRYRFVHVLYQNALYASLRPTRKASLSGAVAEALLRHYGTERTATIAAELAMLFEAARDFERAAEFFLLAAQQSARVSANNEVVVLARRGLDALMTLPETRQRAEQELRLQTALGPALMATIGLGARQVEDVYKRAEALCQEVGGTPQLFTAIFGLWQYWIARGAYQTCRKLSEQLLALAQQLRDPAFELLAHNAVGNTCGLTGELECAVAHNRQAISIYVPGQHHALASRYSGWDPGVACRSGLAKNLWLSGYPDQAVESARDAIALARDIAHPYSEVNALTFASMVHQHRRDALRTRQQTEAAIALATELGLVWWLLWATALRGWALVELGHGDDGIVQLHETIARWRAMTTGLAPYFLSLLADACKTARRTQEALTALDEAFAITKQTHEGYVEAELYRLKGEFQIDPAGAESCFHQAIEIARRQQAKSFELRAVVSLTKLYQKQGKHAVARDTLAEIYGWFTEGFDTADLKEARELLTSI